MYIFLFGPSSSPCISFSMLFIHSRCLLWSLHSHILLQNYFASFTFGCKYVFTHFPALAGRIFFCCFRMSSLVYIVSFYLIIFLVYLLLPVASLSPRVVSSLLLSLLLLLSDYQRKKKNLKINGSEAFSDLLTLFFFHIILVINSQAISHLPDNIFHRWKLSEWGMDTWNVNIKYVRKWGKSSKRIRKW